MDLPEITAVQRFTLGPNEHLVFRSDQRLTEDMADRLKVRAARTLNIPPSRVLVLGDGWTLETLEIEECQGS